MAGESACVSTVAAFGFRVGFGMMFAGLSNGAARDAALGSGLSKGASDLSSRIAFVGDRRGDPTWRLVTEALLLLCDPFAKTKPSDFSVLPLFTECASLFLSLVAGMSSLSPFAYTKLDVFFVRGGRDEGASDCRRAAFGSKKDDGAFRSVLLPSIGVPLGVAEPGRVPFGLKNVDRAFLNALLLSTGVPSGDASSDRVLLGLKKAEGAFRNVLLPPTGVPIGVAVD
jgi:hypothetical protein